ncbi:unnamed protein product [Cladocopium goreaui]|uniref:Diatom spindle kinesin-1 n=1 Tax=Cladocopium goreaui TaxID=2562237 RepID=A0A9P1GDX8_9DINO|nr:unnamed protein product [Cladocopium goreaui]|mmetsp:Transcript_47926/g.104500  ORF Transcript_47926/g.104500 Transcript_47926/m.104500 type:complete len:854 (-) Transcript_47926:58-2619(-)
MAFALAAAALLSSGLAFCPTLEDTALDQACDAEDSSLVQLQKQRHRLTHALAVKGDRSSPLKLADFQQTGECYDRKANNNWAVVDAHLHPRPFGGKPVAFSDLMGRLRRAGILFTTLYGIGQRLPVDSSCSYYLDCPGTDVMPSLKNDFFNAQSVLDSAADLADPSGPRITLSMSFIDLHDPAGNLEKMQLLQNEFPGMFKWVGEINLVKQALWPNHQGLPVELDTVPTWKPFMDEFLKQDIPLALHCDLGNDENGTQFLPLMDKVLDTYPNNKIIWVHMAGISKQLKPHLAAKGVSLLQKLKVPVTIEDHVAMIGKRLEKHPKLMIDLSWDILYDELYASPAERELYVNLINKYPDRFLSGSDHVASEEKTENTYRQEIKKTSAIFLNLSDVAFRNIALGQNYFNLTGLNFTAPKVCSAAPEVLLEQENLRAPHPDKGAEVKLPTSFPSSRQKKQVMVATDDFAQRVEVLPAIADFRKGSRSCFDRTVTDNWAVVDAHLHARPFGGPPVPFSEMMDRQRRAGVLFTTLYGIGQRLPVDSNCTYYLDCPGTPVKPSLKNDFFNAQSVLDNQQPGITPLITLSMSFFDLDHPETILPNMKLLQTEFPGMFRWAGEINLVKQALWKNLAGQPVPIESIPKWKQFMAELRRQDIPMAIHSDLGDEVDGTKFLPLMDKVLSTYPKNKIIWVHMAGISKQLDPKLSLLQRPVFIQQHVKLIHDRLNQYPNLYIDLSWDVLYDSIYHDSEEEKPYIELINKHPTRFLSGSDHVAAAAKTESSYRNELAKVNAIYKELSDEAFINIALGGNYFKLAHLDEYVPPPICRVQFRGSKHFLFFVTTSLAVAGIILVFLLRICL